MKCPKCGCDWEKYHHMTINGVSGYHCINCDNHLCYLPKGVTEKAEDLQAELDKAEKDAQAVVFLHKSYIKDLKERLTSLGEKP